MGRRPTEHPRVGWGWALPAPYSAPDTLLVITHLRPACTAGFRVAKNGNARNVKNYEDRWILPGRYRSPDDDFPREVPRAIRHPDGAGPHLGVRGDLGAGGADGQDEPPAQAEPALIKLGRVKRGKEKHGP